ncbi:hypothetical protein PYCCODRAFT_1185280 [Trametes coccinea BRFM310]|uniref:Uncharacterized protein n=1 Tax=Trametes coccinea (strain BRFM310) TaxID=1353009 RepID=A0A1Y2I7U2_TRAC3|nr:hypothetical protein PYCCODRAFT_1185280 [Trametes coccinea BRFM310]
MSQSPESTISPMPSTLSTHAASGANIPPSPAPAPAPAPASSSTPSPAPLEEHIERLTDLVHDIGDRLDGCSKASDARYAAWQSREEAQRQRAESAQAQLARIAAMAREMVRRETEERVTAEPEKYARDLQRAAFGTGGSADSISRSSMMMDSSD